MVPSWCMTIEAAAMASSIASCWLAPAARAAARLAVTASPAPTMSISPRTGWAGTCSERPPVASAPTMPSSASVTKTGWRFRAARSSRVLLHGVDPDDRSAGHPCELSRVHLETHGRKITAGPAGCRPAR